MGTDKGIGAGVSITFEAYQRESATTAVYPGAGDQGSVEGLSYTTLGLAGEAGEIANKVKKILRDSGGEITVDHRLDLAGELGDVLWYMAAMARQLGVSLADVAMSNRNKLADRQRRGTLQGSGDKR